VTLVIALAVLGSLNATILAGGRISYAMACRGAAFASLGRLSPRLGTPSVALWVQASLAMLLVLTGRFEELVNYVVVVMLVSVAMSVGTAGTGGLALGATAVSTAAGVAAWLSWAGARARLSLRHGTSRPRLRDGSRARGARAGARA